MSDTKFLKAFIKKNKTLIQSPHLYLQAAGSTGADGSTPGMHLRWDLIGALGNKHIPKGDFSGNNHNFNQHNNDFVYIFRSAYLRKYPTVIDFFKDRPIHLVPQSPTWIYRDKKYGNIVYVHFRDRQRYQQILTQFNPQEFPWVFFAAYGSSVIEVELPEQLCFASNMGVVTTGMQTTMQVEGISVEENTPGADRFVSIRKVFHGEEICRNKEREKNNLLKNPSFEKGEEGFDTDFIPEMTPQSGRYAIVKDAQEISRFWKGIAVDENRFMAFSPIGRQDRTVWSQELNIKPKTDYCFQGAVALLAGERPIQLKLQITAILASGAEKVLVEQNTFTLNDLGAWQYFNLSWSNTRHKTIQVKVLDFENSGTRAGVGLDQLYFGKYITSAGCIARIEGENMNGLRVSIHNGYLRSLSFEIYEDYLEGVLKDSNNHNTVSPLDPEQDWKLLNRFALSLDEQEVFDRLDNLGLNIHGNWPKFNDGDKVNIANYQNKWNRGGGLKNAVNHYLGLSESANNPMALDSLVNDADPNDILSTSYLELLKIASFDYHVARMLGLGHIFNFDQPDKRYLFLAFYVTEGALTDTAEAQPINHFYMSVPTGRIDQRLPEPAALMPPVFGLFIDNGTNEGRNIVNQDGYTPDGLLRYVNFAVKQTELNLVEPQTFFVPSVLFSSLDHTASTFLGIEHQIQGQGQWDRPELSHDQNYIGAGVDPKPETQPIAFPANESTFAYTHKQSKSETHEYAGYGINWFSRASKLSPVIRRVITNIRPANTLTPPSNLQVQLIQAENPLLLTTTAEQTRLSNIPNNMDKTLVRVTFDYHHVQETVYAFGDKAHFLFRSDAPLNTRGGIKSANTFGTNTALWEVRTETFTPNSDQNANPVVPQIAATDRDRFAGGVFVKENMRYIIQEVKESQVAGEGPIFLLQRPLETEPQSNSSGGFIAADGLEASFEIPDNVQFMVLENMAEASNWGAANPLRLQVNLTDNSWSTKTETYQVDGQTKEIKLRGVWETATVTVVLDNQNQATGIYRINFDTYVLGHHNQYQALAESVDWYKGIVRIHKAGQLQAARKTLEVVQINHVGDGQFLELIAVDSSFPSDPIQAGQNIEVNYYPGYQAYLYADVSKGFTEASILPTKDEDSRISFIGMRSLDTSENLKSKVGVPQTLISQAILEPRIPEQPQGADFASRPDADGRSTYSFQLQLQHRPFAVAFYRASEDRLLRALFSAATVEQIYIDLRGLQEQEGGDPLWANRWRNLIGLDYTNAGDPQNPAGAFKRYPVDNGYRFPRPDRAPFFDGTKEPGHQSINNQVIEAIHEAFVPLTEQPLFYKYIKEGNYLPQPKAQSIRDRNGKVLAPTHPDFDQAPMAKIIGNNRLLFTDFTLDGGARNFYFYCAREIGSQMKLGEYSVINGPIQLINSAVPEAPVVKQILSLEADPLLNTGPAIDFVFNPYPSTQKIKRLKIYRTLQANEALTPRAMQEVKTIEINPSQSGPIRIQDAFEDVPEYPFGETLFYRAVAIRSIQAPDSNGNLVTEYVPSKASQVMLSTIVDILNPASPNIIANIGNSTLIEHQLVELSWEKTAYNGIYRLYKMNSKAQWELLNTITTNDTTILHQLPNALPRVDAAGQAVFHHFKVMAENASGLTSLEERILTI